MKSQGADWWLHCWYKVKLGVDELKKAKPSQVPVIKFTRQVCDIIES